MKNKCKILMLILTTLISAYLLSFSTYADENEGDIIVADEEPGNQTIDWSLSKNDLEICTEGDLQYIDIESSTGSSSFTAESSDPEILSAVYYYNSNSVELIPYKAGTVTVTIKDELGNQQTCKVTVTTLKWNLEKTEHTVLLDDYSDYISIEYPNGYPADEDSFFTVESSDSDIVSVDGLYLFYHNCGSAVITVTDKYGNSSSQTVIVKHAEWHLEISSVDMSVDDYPTNIINIITKSTDNQFTVTSSDSDIITAVFDEESYHIEYTVHNVGSAIISVTDVNGVEEKCVVNVAPARWHLSTTEITGLYPGEGELIIEELSEHLDLYSFTVESSDEDIVSINGTSWNNFNLDYNGVGVATITVSDPFGKSESCKVSVSAYPLKLERTTVTFDTAFSYYEGHVFEFIPVDVWHGYSDNIIKKVSSSNPKVVTGKINTEVSGVFVNPVKAGSAIVTVQDQYGQTAQIRVKVTQKYIDEKKYLPDLDVAYIHEPEYGETKLYCLCDIEATVYATINGIKYTAKLNSDGYYVFDKIPRLAAGKKIKVFLKRGQAISEHTIVVQKVNGRSTTVVAKNRTFTGKPLGTALTVKYGSTVLKKGTDYTVKYSNNKNVGKATATITFIGNYKSVKAVTYNICPKGTTISGLTRAKRGFSVKWVKQAAKMSTSQITGYQIQYSTNSKFASGNKVVTVKGVNNVSKKISSLKANREYYVRIRTYKTVGGKNYYSAWSATKNVKTK